MRPLGLPASFGEPLEFWIGLGCGFVLGASLVAILVGTGVIG